jgi:hypothetical protein
MEDGEGKDKEETKTANLVPKVSDEFTDAKEIISPSSLKH